MPESEPQFVVLVLTQDYLPDAPLDLCPGQAQVVACDGSHLRLPCLCLSHSHCHTLEVTHKQINMIYIPWRRDIYIIGF